MIDDGRRGNAPEPTRHKMMRALNVTRIDLDRLGAGVSEHTFEMALFQVHFYVPNYPMTPTPAVSRRTASARSGGICYTHKEQYSGLYLETVDILLIPRLLIILTQ